MSAFTMYTYSRDLPYYHIGFWRALLVSKWLLYSLQASIGRNTQKY